jgi:hypothetical protein
MYEFFAAASGAGSLIPRNREEAVDTPTSNFARPASSDSC